MGFRATARFNSGGKWYDIADNVPDEVAKKVTNPACLAETSADFPGFPIGGDTDEVSGWVLDADSPAAVAARAKYALDIETQGNRKPRTSLTAFLEEATTRTDPEDEEPKPKTTRGKAKA